MGERYHCTLLREKSPPPHPQEAAKHPPSNGLDRFYLLKIEKLITEVRTLQLSSVVKGMIMVEYYFRNLLMYGLRTVRTEWSFSKIKKM